MPFSETAIVTVQNITRQEHAELQISTQKNVLDMIAAGEPLERTAELIIEYLEHVVPGSRVAIYQIERDTRRVVMVAGPNVDLAFSGESPDFAGDPVSRMCVEVLASRTALLCPTVSSEAVPKDFAALLAATDLKAIWSYPVAGAGQRSNGVICLCRDSEGAPDSGTQDLIDTASALLRVALDRVQIERELRYQSFNDELTGLPNRVLLMDRIDIALHRAAQSDDQVALLLLNIDKFQMVNNSLGYHAGDELLKEVARRLRDCLRSDDLVGRFTGDSFGILLERISSEADAINVVMRIQRAFATPFKATGVDIYISVSIGIALATDPETDADSFIRFSDIALNRAKEAGRGQFAVFSPSQDLSRVPRIQLQSRLHRALAADALELHYQPVMSLKEHRVAGYEALARWNDAQFGTIAPDEFLPLAQQSGIMSEITSWVLDRAVTQLCDWYAMGEKDIFAAVNISPSEMTDSLLVEQVDAVLRCYQVQPECLILEMIEHALLDTTGRPSSILERLRKLGVRVALDDFGTGYSSLSYLEYLAVDVIKIDRTFTQAARGGASRAPVATAMVDLARKLGMLSVAEGIETEEDERVARQLGCDLSQGYRYGRPQPGDRLPPRPQLR
jgi:diguanylate cyclase (GGDEF)-like protein